MSEKEIISISDKIRITDSVKIYVRKPGPMLNIGITIRNGSIESEQISCDDNFDKIYVHFDIFDYEVIQDFMKFDSMIRKIVCNAVPWLKMVNNVLCLDADRFKISYPKSDKFDWLYGYIEIKGSKGSDPKDRKFDFSFSLDGDHMDYHSKINIPPTEIKNSILEFKRDNPLDCKTAFIITKFSEKHKHIIDIITSECRNIGINAYTASDISYHKNLFENVLTYIWCSKLIFVVYDELVQGKVSPNVDIEFGYALALQKEIILLKEKNVNRPTDINGIIYEEFDYENLNSSIESIFSRRRPYIEKTILPPT